MIIDKSVRLKMTDEERNVYENPFIDIMQDYIKQQFYELISFYIATSYNTDSMWSDDTFEKSCLDALSYTNSFHKYENIELDEINKILNEKFNKNEC